MGFELGRALSKPGRCHAGQYSWGLGDGGFGVLVHLLATSEPRGYDYEIEHTRLHNPHASPGGPQRPRLDDAYYLPHFSHNHSTFNSFKTKSGVYGGISFTPLGLELMILARSFWLGPHPAAGNTVHAGLKPAHLTAVLSHEP